MREAGYAEVFIVYGETKRGKDLEKQIGRIGKQIEPILRECEEIDRREDELMKEGKTPMKSWID